MSRRLLGGWLVASALVACGGKLAPLEEAAGPGDAGTTRSFGVADAYALPPVHCVACAADDECGGPQYACVARAAGGGYCLAGCSKDGFCLAGQTCAWVKDPIGRDWRACLPSNDDCGP
jgi:hypothetical protein